MVRSFTLAVMFAIFAFFTHSADAQVTFTDINAGLKGVAYGCVVWGDYNNDGQLDLLVSGEQYSSSTSGLHPFSQVYRNAGGTFTAAAQPIAMCYSAAAWGDYDGDGDLDLAMSGRAPVFKSSIYRNDNGVLTDINAGLVNVAYGSLAWGDYDNDGDLDLVIGGRTDYDTNAGTTKLYRNEAGRFVEITAGIEGIRGDAVAWADYDNDGDLDLSLAGYQTGPGFVANIYRNDNGVFTYVYVGVNVSYRAFSWGDYDGDGEWVIV